MYIFARHIVTVKAGYEMVKKLRFAGTGEN